MTMHAGAVITVEWLGHEGRAFVMALGYVAHRVFKNLQVVGGANQSGIAKVDFALAGGGDFMVMAFNLNAGLLQLVGDFGAKVLERVERREGDISFFVANMVAEIRVPVLAVRIPDRFRIVYREAGGMSLVLKPHVVEDKEFGLRTEIDRIGDARGLQIALSPMPHAARIEPITLPGDRIDDVGHQAEGLFVHEGIDPVTIWIRHQQHVGFVDRRPAAQARAVKAEALFERLFRKLVDRKRQVMPGANQIGETNVNVGRSFISRKLQHIFHTHRYSSSFQEIGKATENNAEGVREFGVRRQSEAPTPLWIFTVPIL